MKLTSAYNDFMSIEKTSQTSIKLYYEVVANATRSMEISLQCLITLCGDNWKDYMGDTSHSITKLWNACSEICPQYLPSDKVSELVKDFHPTLDSEHIFIQFTTFIVNHYPSRSARRRTSESLAVLGLGTSDAIKEGLSLKISDEFKGIIDDELRGILLEATELSRQVQALINKHSSESY
ncbi:MAG: hypothetical protein EOP06_01055 [Proteobacteria bacterium]|nr:MAG: hypothetical protein EOP06_01055 [Pseudomonadota bacterium]